MLNKRNILKIVVLILIVAIPLLYIGGDFEGADALAENVVNELNPGFSPWFENGLPELSGEMETLMFTIQAALGGGIVGYIIGHMRGRRYAQK